MVVGENVGETGVDGVVAVDSVDEFGEHGAGREYVVGKKRDRGLLGSEEIVL